MARRTVHVDGGLLRIEQRIRVPGRAVGTDVSGPAYIFAHIRVTRGTVAYVGSHARVCAPGACLLVLPPSSIVQAVLERCDVTSVAVAFRTPRHADLPPHPALLPWDAAGALPAPGDMSALVRLAREGIDIGRAGVPDSLAARGKAIIDAQYVTPVAIAQVAERLGTSPAAFSRAFRAAYGVPPVRYRHQVRIVDALTRLAGGAAPIDVAPDVGFEDLSRFYKVFRMVACASPGTYRLSRSRNAKT
jgi:AraC-like DNA-binding protein